MKNMLSTLIKLTSNYNICSRIKVQQGKNNNFSLNTKNKFLQFISKSHFLSLKFISAFNRKNKCQMKAAKFSAQLLVVHCRY